LIWFGAARVACRRPLLAACFAALLAATNMLQWRLGVFDGATARDIAPAGLALFLGSKLAVVLALSLAGLRLAADAAMPLRRAIALDRRQVRWLLGTLAFIPLALLLRIAVQAAVGSVLTPLGAGRAAVTAVTLGLYMLLIFTLYARINPGWTGVMLGDRDAGLRWSWAATRGRAVGLVALFLAALVPPLAIHFAANFALLGDAVLQRAIVLTLDGAVMLMFTLVATGAYVFIYRQVRQTPAAAPDTAMPLPAA